MANSSTYLGYYNLPAQIIATGTDTPLLVPAQGLYSTLPSPTFAAGTGLFTGPVSEVFGNASVDGHPFTVRVAGKAHVAATGAFTVSFKLGSSATSASNTTIGGATKASASVTAPGDINFYLEIEAIWDSTSQSLAGVITGVVGGALLAPTVITTPIVVANATSTTTPNFQFIPSFTFGAANAANSVTVTELTVDRGV
jgi:hypothetical protein